MPANYPLHVVLTAIDRVSGPLRRINATVSRLNSPFVRVNNAMRSLANDAGVPRLARSFGNVGSAVQGVQREVSSLAGTFAKVAIAGCGAAYLFKRQFIDTADQFERLKFSLEAIEGSAEAGAKSMAFLKKMTVETPFEMNDLAQAFRTMRGFGMDPTNGSLKSIVEQVAKIGGTGEQLQGIVLQLGQAFGKTKLQAQDVRPLIERGVPVWAILQRAAERMGKKIPIKQLQEMSESGKLGLSAINALIEQMGIESAGSSARMMKSWTGLMSNISDQWTFFKLRVMDSGPFDLLKGKLQGILDTIQAMKEDGSLDRIAELWGKRIVEGLRTAWRITQELYRGFRDAWRVLGPIVVAFGVLVEKMGGAETVAKALVGLMGVKLVASVIKLGGALLSVNAALVGTPLGLLLLGGAAAVGGLIWAVSSLKKDRQIGSGRGAHGERRSFNIPQSSLLGPPGGGHGSRGSLDVNVRVSGPAGTEVRTGGRGVRTRVHRRGGVMPESAR